ncbi:interferon-induced protein with tetratricopeptide repeats 2-like [Eumetopias jubatus]|uniref:interferon-induced protein with tetratricopeptide repeats 2-like n=1 Tax=Eumetopias jubatus TaxID=34886 RepID=UPI001016BF5B|nr:interferon-induced protein with tetratricopeptide repeats 2-like [Eumetopias jubatus]
MSESTRTALESCLRQLKCHFTWDLVEPGKPLDDFEDEVRDATEFQNDEFRATVFNLLAYIECRRGRRQAALQRLRQAEELIQREHAAQAEIRSLVTWGNYAWVYHHLGSHADAQMYVDKVRQVCEKSRSPYRMESPALDFEEGWARLQCAGRHHHKRAKVCFEKALEKEPRNPEFASGLAIASYRLDIWPQSQNPVDLLRRAIRLNPHNQYAKVLLALKLQKMNEEGEGDRLVEEALKGAPCATDVLCGAAKLYQRKGAVDKAIELLRKALEGMPNNASLHWHIGCLYRTKVLEIQDTGTNEMYGRRKLQEAIGQAVHHLKRVDEANADFPCVCSYLACLCAQVGQYDHAEHYFQKEFSKALSPGARQVLHLRYGNFQLYQMKSEDKAIHHFIQGVKIDLESKEKEKMKNKLQKIACIRLSKNEADSVALHLLAFLQELSRDMRPAEENPERHLDSGSFLFSASFAEE